MNFVNIVEVQNIYFNVACFSLSTHIRYSESTRHILIKFDRVITESEDISEMVMEALRIL